MRLLRGVAIIALVVVLLVSLGRWIGSGTQGVRNDPRLLPITTTNVAWSPDGLRIAAVSDGVLRVFHVADGAEELATGRNIVAAAWMPDAKRVLVAEGPIPTGQVATVDLRGRVTGVAHLSPSIDFDTGRGLSVNSDGSRAIAVNVTTDDLGGATHADLAAIELATGKVTVTPTPTVDEQAPTYVDDDTVAFLAGDRLFVRNLSTGADRLLGDANRIVGVAPDGRVAVSAGCCTLTLYDPVTGAGVVQPVDLRRPTAADPLLRRYLVVEGNGSRIVGITV